MASIFSTSDKSISIEVYENGWLLDWKDDSIRSLHRTMRRSLRSIGIDDDDAEPATSGREIFTDKKKLAKRIADFLGIPLAAKSREAA